MDYLDAAAACRAAAPWETLRFLKEIRVEVGWEAIEGCAPVQFPILRLLEGANGGFHAFSSQTDAAAFLKGGLGAVTDVVMKVTWEPRRGGAAGEVRPKVAVIAPGVAEDGAVGTLACPPTPSEEVWATLVLCSLEGLAREVGLESGAGSDASPPDIWAVHLSHPVTLRNEVKVRAGDLRATVIGTVTLTGLPAATGVAPGASFSSKSKRQWEQQSGRSKGGDATEALQSARSYSTVASEGSVAPREVCACE